MSHIGDTSDQTLDVVTPGSTSGFKVSSSSSMAGESAKRLKFNQYGLPIGPNKACSATRLGELVRTHIPISFNKWPTITSQYKDQLWKAFRDEYPDVSDTQREIFMGKANNAWRKLKTKLRANLVDSDVTQWKEKVPKGIKSEEWEKFCDHEAMEGQKLLRKRNKKIKNNSERKTTHNTGRYGYAEAAKKWEDKHGHPPTRTELWLDTHQRKDGTYAPHDQKFAMALLLKLFQERGEKETLDSGPIYETFGQDSGGRVRCIGSTISRKAVLASAFARDMLKKVNVERDEWMLKVNDLREEMEGVKSTFTEFINDFKCGKFAQVAHNIHATTPTTATPTDTHVSSASQFSTIDDLTPCKIQSHTGEIVGYGRKVKLGAVKMVHGHCLRPREVRVILDIIKVPEFSVWGGKQSSCNTLADVGRGGFMYWHDDFLPPLDDTN